MINGRNISILESRKSIHKKEFLFIFFVNLKSLHKSLKELVKLCDMLLSNELDTVGSCYMWGLSLIFWFLSLEAGFDLNKLPGHYLPSLFLR